MTENSQSGSISVISGGGGSGAGLPVFSSSTNQSVPLNPSAAITSSVSATNSIEAVGKFQMIPGRLVRPASANSLANGGIPMENDGRQAFPTVTRRTPTPLPAYRIPLPTNLSTGIPVSAGVSGAPSKTGTIKRNPLSQGANKAVVGGNFKMTRSTQKKATQV